MQTPIPLLILCLSLWQPGLAGAVCQCELDEISSPVGLSTEEMGRYLALSGGTLALAEDPSHPVRRVFLYQQEGLRWPLEQILDPQDARPIWGLGLDGDWLAVALRGGLNRIQLWERRSQVWELAQVLEAGGAFGRSIALEQDTLLVGSPNEGLGRAYVFENVGGVWTQTAVIDGPGGDTFQFGRRVELKGDVAVVAATKDPAGHIEPPRSSLHVLERSSSSWNQTWTFSDAVALGNVPIDSIAISATTIAIGQPEWGEPDTWVGRVHIMERSTGSWAYAGPIQQPDPIAFDLFGTDLAFSGADLVIGTPGRDADPPTAIFAEGALEVFRADSAGAWLHERSVRSELGTSTDALGYTVDTSGLIVAAGTPRREIQGTLTGGASLFELSDAQGVVVCHGNPNSTGGPGSLFVRGSLTALSNELRLDANGLPVGSVTIGIVGPTSGVFPGVGGSQGTLCIALPVGRMLNSIRFANGVGRVSIPTDLTVIPQPTGTVSAAAGQTWVFQLWHRDTTASSIPTSNLTNSVRVLLR